MLRWIKWLLLYYCNAASLITALSLGCEPFPPDATSDAPLCELVKPNRNICSFRNSVWNTSYPNVFNHTSYSQASLFLDNFAELVEAKCSEHLSYFLCYAVFPLCFSGTFHKVEPCQEMCVAVRENCTPFLNSNGREWPPELDCNQFPPDRSKICVWNGKNCQDLHSEPAASLDTSEQPITKSVTRRSLANCTGHLVRYPNLSFAQYGGIDNCDERCHGVYLTNNQQNFNTVWMAIWSLLCLFVSIVTFLTWVLNYKAIKSPESPVYCIALSYTFMTLSYTISIAVGEQGLTCNPDIKNALNESALITNGLHFPLCITLFSVTYFFTLSSWLWWALLNVEWLICSVKSYTIGIKWRICSQLVGWGVPIVFLLIALGTESVGGNSILKTCWIRKHKEVSYLIGPLFTVIVFSCVVILISFTRVTKLQRVLKSVDHDQESVDHITTQIQVSLYTTIYLLPMGILLCCYWYEYWYREQWEHSYIDCLHSPTCTSPQKPLFTIIKLKFAVSVIMGIVSGAWIFRKSSIRAWQKVCCICCQSDKQSVDIQEENIRNIQFTHEPYSARHSFSETSV